MPTQSFDTEINIGSLKTATLHGKITGLIVQEWDGTFTDPAQTKKNFVNTNNIMRTDRDWQIMLTWKLMGTFLDMTPPATGPVSVELHGNFLINAYLEGLGKNADEIDLAGDTLGGIPLMSGQKAIVKSMSVPANPGNPTATPPVPPTPAGPPETEWQYNETFTIKAATSTAPMILKPGAYKLSVNLTYGLPVLDSKGKQETTTDPDKGYGPTKLLFTPGPMAGFMESADLIQVYDPGTF